MTSPKQTGLLAGAAAVVRSIAPFSNGCNIAPVPHAGSWVVYVAFGSALGAAAILLRYLIKRPPLDLSMKLWLFLGLGVLPSVTALASTVAGMERTTHREFCGSCHVMAAHLDDASTLRSQSLAARHTRVPFFGEQSCYVCHADYGMYGYPLTKLGGLRHVYLYYLGGYADLTLEQAKREIHIAKPYDNMNCRQCHTTTARVWRDVPDHISMERELFSNQVSCASAGCHGFAHPFTKNLPPLREGQH
ncbi:MAG TPA: NapC/NirT family cytochrome c [Polyangiaceae bacterium]|nr:NapC/NirT family cytochrome c [Polyangiaceae bacterium]